MFIHECLNCGRYFIHKEEKNDQFCWKCGQGLVISKYYALEAKDKVHKLAMKILFNQIET